MSVRLQVLVDPEDIARFQQVAHKQGLTLSAWVRQVLLGSVRSSPQGDVSRKMAALRAASKHRFPAPDIDNMLEEIEKGYTGGDT